MLSNGQLTAVVLQDSPLVGNIPERAANAIFSQGLLYALEPEARVALPINAVAMLTFMEAAKTNGHRPLRPLSLTQISENMNRIIKSAAKAYISGFKVDDTDSTNPIPALLPDYVWLSQSAILQYRQLSVISNSPFFLALGVLDGVIVAILAILMMTVDTADMWLFSLQTLEKVYRRGATPLMYLVYSNFLTLFLPHVRTTLTRIFSWFFCLCNGFLLVGFMGKVYSDSRVINLGID